jgi:hypothetical protein
MVHYLHRTVRDYMERPVVLEPFVDRAEKNDFKPHTAILRSYVTQLIAAGISCFKTSDLLSLAATALLYTHEADITHQLPNVKF